ncbi:MAG TPA: hypothetical protein VL096_04610 [Pirellulaceae bacterium]|nr:hypothetical protein [Pirellulaceae bacterium]
MEAKFDPYQAWLGIPPAEQPPHFYRLLGLPPLEQDLALIASAAQIRSRHLHGLRSGAHSGDAERLLRELKHAQQCLLHPGKKTQYDEQLAAALAQRAANDAPLRLVPIGSEGAPQPAFTPGASIVTGNAKRRAARRPNIVHELFKIVGGGLAGIIVGFIVLSFLREEWDTLGLAKAVRGKQPPAVVNSDPVVEEPVAVEEQPAPRTRPKDRSPTPRSTGPSRSPRAEPTSPPATAAERTPPSGAALMAIRERLKAQLQITDAQLLVEAAKDRPADERYVLLMAARDQAATTGDGTTALRVVDELTQHYNIETFPLALQTLTLLRASCTSAAANRQLAEAALAHLALASVERDSQDLQPLTDLSLAVARKSADPTLIRRATLEAIKLRNLNQTPRP